jgi:glycosyltransferase involved in cell wall biosynthesis
VRYVPPPLPPVRPAGFALPPIEERPLVSVILPTYNRPNDLAVCLADLERQTYRPLEVLVLNDAGDRVDEIVARYPFARLVTFEQNVGALRALVAGFELVRGTYVQLLADDDTLYPDHIERIMAALLASGAAVAHGNSLIRYQQRLDDGSLVTVGFNALSFADTTTPTEALKATSISGQAFIIRRDIIDEIGGFRTDCVLADQEFQLRAADRYAFAYADHTTVEWRVRGKENFSSNVDSYAAVKQVFEEMHPRPDRPMLEFERKALLEGVATRPKGFIFAPTIKLRTMPGEPVP